MKRWIWMSVVSVLVVGCGSDDARPETPADEDVDHCEVYGWYGDGTCDESCPLRDSDCDASNNTTPPGDVPPGTNPDPRPSDPPVDPPADPPSDPPADPPGDCKALPICNTGELPVDPMTCLAAGDECSSRELCGEWAHCLAVPDVCADVVGAPASCPSGFVPVDECASEECVIARGSGDQCSDVLFCEAEVQCLALATCNADQYNVATETCLSLDDDCETRTICGQTLHCVDLPRECPEAEGQPPTCPAGTEPANSCTTRELNQGSCTVVFGTDDHCHVHQYCG